MVEIYIEGDDEVKFDNDENGRRERLKIMLGDDLVSKNETQDLYQISWGSDKSLCDYGLVGMFHDGDRLGTTIKPFSYFDGIIFDKETENVVAHPFIPFTEPSFMTLGLCPFIKTYPFSASLKVEGDLLMVYNYKGKWEASSKNAIESTKADSVLYGLNRFQQTERMNPAYTYLFIEEILADMLVGIINTKTGIPITQNMVNMMSERIGFTKPMQFEFRTFEQACDWVKQNYTTLILNYDNGFILKLTPDSLEAINENENK